MSIEEVHEGVYVTDHSKALEVFQISSDIPDEPLQIHEISLQAKKALLEPSTGTYAEGERILRSLEKIDHQTATQFGLKRPAIEHFPFRLCTGADENLPRKKRAAPVC
jgi:hypothetical protein